LRYDRHAVLRVLTALVALLAVARAGAAPVVLHFATAAPDGTAWARLFRTMGRELETNSRGEIASKWYFGGIAGSETEMLDRMHRGQLDVVMSGGMMCMKLSPSMRVLRVLGLFQSRDEASYALGRLRPTIDAEMAQAGYRNIGEAVLGSDMLFTRAPVTSMAELRATRFWYWDLDDAMREQLKALGVPAIGMPVENAERAYEDHRIDGFLAVPTAALAFQWTVASKYLSELRLGALPGCMIMTNRAWDQLSVDARNVVTVAAATFQARLEQLGRAQDEQLLGGLLAKQGLRKLPVPAGFASDFFEAARRVRENLRDKLVPGALIDRVVGWVADFRAEHSRTGH